MAETRITLAARQARTGRLVSASAFIPVGTTLALLEIAVDALTANSGFTAVMEEAPDALTFGPVGGVGTAGLARAEALQRIAAGDFRNNAFATARGFGARGNANALLKVRANILFEGDPAEVAIVLALFDALPDLPLL